MSVETGELDLGIALSVTADALRTAVQELEQIQAVDIPMPDWLVKTLDQHAAMKETLALLRRKTDVDIDALYREAQERARWTGPQLGTFPVMEEVTAQVNEAMELLRRAHLTVPVVRDALDGIQGGWQA